MKKNCYIPFAQYFSMGFRSKEFKYVEGRGHFIANALVAKEPTSSTCATKMSPDLFILKPIAQ
jgi:hypothetical protein